MRDFLRVEPLVSGVVPCEYVHISHKIGFDKQSLWCVLFRIESMTERSGLQYGPVYRTVRLTERSVSQIE
jgi:hypothetical protein